MKMIKKIAIVILLFIAAVFVGLLMLAIALPFLLPVLLPWGILFSILVINGRRKQKRGK